MTQTHKWGVEIYIDEHADDRTTHAEARLHTNDRTTLVGTGTAHRHPRDREIAEIGDELAAARALSDLAHQILHAAALDIEEITNKRVHLTR